MPSNLSINHNDMRNMNLALILNCLHQHAPLSRARLAELTGLNRATVTHLVRELIYKGLLVEMDGNPRPSAVGHPSINLQINPNAGRVIGVEVGVDYTSAVLTDLCPKILWRYDAQHPFSQDVDEVMERVLLVVDHAYRQARQSGFPILGIAVGVPGLVDLDSDTLLQSPEFGWRNVSLREHIGRHFDVPFYSGNLVHMAALGESYFGAARRVSSSVYIHLGYTVSGGIVINEDVFPGAMGLAGEVGHMSIDPYGARCACGSRGCWNLFVSQQGLFRRLEERMAQGAQTLLSAASPLTMTAVLDAASHGDALTLEALHQSGVWLGIGIANLVNILNPQYVVLGGAMSLAFDFFAPAMYAELAERALLAPGDICKVTVAKYCQDAALIGAVATVIWNILNHPQS